MVRYTGTMKGIAVWMVVALLSIPPGHSYGNTSPKVGVLPFSDLDSREMDLKIPALLQQELSEQEGLEVIPLEVTFKTLERVRPEALWRVDGEEGILLSYRDERVVELLAPLSVDFIVYGDLSRFGKTIRINIYMVGKGGRGPRAFAVEGKEEELPPRLASVAGEIASSIASQWALEEAEEYIRAYRGGLYTYEVALDLLAGLFNRWGSLPIGSLYLSLLLERKGERMEEVLRVGRRLMDLYSPQREEETRLLLSLGIDPFHIVAEIYESKGDLEEAIEVRKRAIEMVVFGRKRHIDALGRDLYRLGLEAEERDPEMAERYYREALKYLPPPSELYRKVQERLNP